jgi:hypothetical protein
MSIKEEYHNVSVRLKDSEYKKLIFLHDKFSRMSYGKVTLADVLRISVNETWLRESKEPNKPVSDLNWIKNTPNIRKLSMKDIEQAIAENPEMLAKLAELTKEVHTPKEQFLNELEAVQAVTEDGEIKPTVKSYDDIETELAELEKNLREATNSKNKPYSEKYIQDQLSKRRKELES